MKMMPEYEFLGGGGGGGGGLKTGLSPPVKYFADRSKAVLLLWNFYVCYAFVCVCLYVPCGHLLGKG